MIDYNIYLIRLLQEEAESARIEVSAIRNSLRYRVGGFAVQAFPPSLRSLRPLSQLIRLFLLRRKDAQPVKAVSSLSLVVNMQAPLWMLSSAHELDSENTSVWITDNVGLLVQCADKTTETKTLVLRVLSTAVLQRIARLQLQGWHIIWDPQLDVEHDAAMTAYIVSSANEYRLGGAI